MEKEELKHSHILLVARSMESDRRETDVEYAANKTYKYEKLIEQSSFEIFYLSFVMRSSMQINAIVGAAIPILIQAIMKSVI